ncbi:hypothetical protein OMB55_00019250 [gamma proteobacterium HIMB55]|nr:hypothetical protein OMB55_00019250 [gamma proteobacterium HIMB55]
MNAREVRGLTSAVAGLVVFGFWMSLVGNPHVIETVIGLALSFFTGYKVYNLSYWSRSD